MADPNYRIQYSVLARVKQFDERVFRLRIDLERIPREIQEMEEGAQAHRQKFESVKVEVEGLEKQARSLEIELREFEEKVKKAEGKLMEVKTNEQYQAAQKEIDVQKQEKGQLEDSVLLLLSKLDGEKVRLKSNEKEYEGFVSEIKKDTSGLEEQRARLLQFLEEETKKRADALKELPSETISLYEKISVITKGVPIVMVDQAMCLGCNMKIRPQLYNEILGFKTIHRCPSCGRILIYNVAEEAENSSYSRVP